MALFRKKAVIPGKEEALPGRSQPLKVPETHFVNGHRIVPPFPAGLKEAVFGMGCFWGAERLFWKLPGVYSTAVGYAGGYTPNATYQEVCSGETGHTEVVRVIYDPEKIDYEDLLKVFWESHDPTQGMRQGNDVGTQYRSAIYALGRRAEAGGARSRSRTYQARSDSGRPWRDHDRDRGCADVLLCRGLSPAVPGEESGWLLRDWGVWGALSNPRSYMRGRRRSRRVHLVSIRKPRGYQVRYALFCGKRRIFPA